MFGENVFSIGTMKQFISDDTYKSLIMTIHEGKTLDPSIADEVADAMKTWAMSRGATHYTHWFQPLTGLTAEKHDSFLVPDYFGGVVLQFSGKELTRGEPDASSFPSGGLRSTFEARGYTAWDPTSPAFIREGPNGATLCIPSVFCGYRGEALDKKTPLLRSIQALSRQVLRLARLFGIDTDGKRAYPTLGPEQEYFLIDREYYNRRLDIIQTGRTLFGSQPAKHQQMEDHYFGSIKTRILAFMTELDYELWRVGVPAHTRHNEVSPAQFEIAPTYEGLNIAVDNNMILMETLRVVAERYGLVCLLHEKPFAGVNGSGKHNNWSIVGPDGKNWLSPGDDPRENAKFLTMICAFIWAIDTYAGLLRASVASAGNDHRLGGNEAPPAILSLFLGTQLTDIMEQIMNGSPSNAVERDDFIEIGVSSIPKLPKDITDRNRTSPVAFTGDKFEFRMVGSSQSCAGPNVVLNTIIAEALNRICSALEREVEAGTDFHDALQWILRDIIVNHRRIIFNGDNYTCEWVEEAERRGLPHIEYTPEALLEIISEKSKDLFTRHLVLSETELMARYEVYVHTYKETIAIEGSCALKMVKKEISPAVHRYMDELASAISSVRALGMTNTQESETILFKVLHYNEKMLGSLGGLEQALKNRNCDDILKNMNALRTSVDELEEIIPMDLWPLPSYSDMMFKL